MTRAAIYARFSSHNQRSESIEIQVDRCQEFAAANEYDVVAVYTDYAQTGTNADRAGLQSMIADAKRKMFDAVIIYKVTRIMRNRDEMALLRITLAKSGVEIIYAGEDISQGSAGILQLGLLETVAEYESALDAERIREGIKKNAERCMANGQTHYGWDIVDGRYQINPTEQSAMVQAKDMYLSGSGVAEITRWLNHHGYRTKRGNEFRMQAVTKLLKRKQNAGVYSFAGYEKPGGMPALWSMSEQEKIWAKMKTVKRPSKHNDEGNYPLSGKLYWDEYPMHGQSGTSKSGTTYYYYYCKHNRRRIPCDKIEDAIVKAVIQTLDDPKTVEHIADMVVTYDAEESGPLQSEILQSQIAEIDVTFERIWRAIEAGITPPGGKERIDELVARKEQLKDELKTAKAIEAVRMNKDRVTFWLETMAKDLDPDKIIEIFVDKVIIHGDDLHIYVYYDDAPVFASGQPDSTTVVLGEHRVYPFVYPVRRGFALVIRL